MAARLIGVALAGDPCRRHPRGCGIGARRAPVCDARRARPLASVPLAIDQTRRQVEGALRAAGYFLERPEVTVPAARIAGARGCLADGVPGRAARRPRTRPDRDLRVPGRRAGGRRRPRDGRLPRERSRAASSSRPTPGTCSASSARRSSSTPGRARRRLDAVEQVATDPRGHRAGDPDPAVRRRPAAGGVGRAGQTVGPASAPPAPAAARRRRPSGAPRRASP